MKLSTFWKTFVMAVVGFIATMISQDIEKINILYVLISTVGFTVLYFGKNWIWPSTSPAWMLNLWESIGSGLFIAIAMAISNFAASILTTGFDLHVFWAAIVTAVIGYFTKTFPTASIAKK